MREGSLEAPVRHPIAWQDEAFYDPAAIDAEMRRQFDVCHTCRRCFNLCNSFPRLFDLIDESKTGELDAVDSKDFASVAAACTLCDMCFMTKCPYVPPHEFNIDFPHLLLRYKAMETRQGKTGFADRQLAETDRNGRMASMTAGLANWATDRGNKTMRGLLQSAAGLHSDADAAEISRQDPARPGEDRARGEPRRACLWPQGGAVRHLFRQLQRARCRPDHPCRAGEARRGNRSGLSRTAAACRCWNRAASPRSPMPRARLPARCRRGSARATTSSPWCRPAR